MAKSCNCNEYKVSTGLQGVPGPPGPQGPVGLPGNRTYLHSIAFTSNNPISNGTSNQILDEYLLEPNILGVNGDTLIINAGFIPAFNTNNKTIKLNFGGYTFSISTPLSYWVFKGNPLIKLEIVVIRTSSSSQLIDNTVIFPVGVSNKWVDNASINLNSNIIISASTTTSAINDILLSYFTIEKIKNDV